MEKEYETFSAQEFFDYYEKSGWKTKNGQIITDFKPLLALWDERKKKLYQEMAKKGK